MYYIMYMQMHTHTHDAVLLPVHKHAMPSACRTAAAAAADQLYTVLVPVLQDIVCRLTILLGSSETGNKWT